MTLDVPLFAREISLFWVAPEVQWGGKLFPPRVGEGEEEDGAGVCLTPLLEGRTKYHPSFSCVHNEQKEKKLTLIAKSVQ